MFLSCLLNGKRIKIECTDTIYCYGVGAAMLCIQWETTAIDNKSSPYTPQQLKLTQASKPGQAINGTADLCSKYWFAEPSPGSKTRKCDKTLPIISSMCRFGDTMCQG